MIYTLLSLSLSLSLTMTRNIQKELYGNICGLYFSISMLLLVLILVLIFFSETRQLVIIVPILLVMVLLSFFIYQVENGLYELKCRSSVNLTFTKIKMNVEKIKKNVQDVMENDNEENKSEKHFLNIFKEMEQDLDRYFTDNKRNRITNRYCTCVLEHDTMFAFSQQGHLLGTEINTEYLLKAGTKLEIPDLAVFTTQTGIITVMRSISESSRFRIISGKYKSSPNGRIKEVRGEFVKLKSGITITTTSDISSEKYHDGKIEKNEYGLYQGYSIPIGTKLTLRNSVYDE